MTVVAALVLGGSCTPHLEEAPLPQKERETSAPAPVKSAPAVSGQWIPMADYAPEPAHERALQVAREAVLAKRTGDPVDYEYRVTFRDGQYSVLVWYVFGYRDDGSSLMKPGGNSVVLVTSSYELDHVIPGR